MTDAFNDLGKLEQALAQRDAMVEALKQSRERLLWIQDVRDGKTSGLPQVTACIEHIDAILDAVGGVGK